MRDLKPTFPRPTGEDRLGVVMLPGGPEEAATTANDLDEPERLELSERLTDRRSSNTKLLGELGLGWQAITLADAPAPRCFQYAFGDNIRQPTMVDRLEELSPDLSSFIQRQRQASWRTRRLRVSTLVQPLGSPTDGRLRAVRLTDKFATWLDAFAH